MTSNLAPICLFTYNRLPETIKTVEALKNNLLADLSDLFIFSDGSKNEDDLTKVESIRNYLKNINGFNSVTIIESQKNKGLATSIVEGVTRIVNEFGKVIVLEDDLKTARYFLKYMNEALEVYEDNADVMQISGFMFPIDPTGLPDTFFYQANTCWGWATWKRAWKHYSDSNEFIFHELKSNKINWKNFNSMQGFAFQMQLIRNKKGILKTWAVKWHAMMKIMNGKVIHPKISLVINTGLNREGTNSRNESIQVNYSDDFYPNVFDAINFENSDKELLALKRLKKYFNKRYSIISIIKRRIN